MNENCYNGVSDVQAVMTIAYRNIRLGNDSKPRLLPFDKGSLQVLHETYEEFAITTMCSTSLISCLERRWKWIKHPEVILWNVLNYEISRNVPDDIQLVKPRCTNDSTITNIFYIFLGIRFTCQSLWCLWGPVHNLQQSWFRATSFIVSFENKDGRVTTKIVQNDN